MRHQHEKLKKNRSMLEVNSSSMKANSREFQNKVYNIHR